VPTTRYEDRPCCTRDGCNNLAALVQDYYDGWANYRKVCATHHKHTWHPSLKNRKDYCENRDGRLGFVCTLNVVWVGMLDVDHINGDSDDETEENYQTLCKCCHAYKTSQNRDWETPGRKTRKYSK
jgi:hypothetical protein